jgi:(p)ppGpp synthase/HD superfamily hydrolase
VDFAYAVHTDVGNRCVACRINRRLAPLSEPLESGQTVEVLTARGARPNPAWFNYAVTAKARTNIRHFLKHQRREDSIALGRRLLEKALASFDTSLDELPEGRLDEYIQQLSCGSSDALMDDIARGDRLPGVVAQQLLGEPVDARAMETRDSAPLAIRGTEGFMVTYAKCCRPLPGDAIAGYLSPERGVVVHRESCRNLAEVRARPERLIALRWDDSVSGEFVAHLRIEVENRRGTIAVIATRINSMGVNIEKISTEDKDYQFTYVDLEILVNNRVHLARIMRRLRGITSVRRVTRVRN